MTFVSRTLIAVAAVAASAPLASALDVVDADIKLGLKLQLQVRAEKSWAENTAGNRYDTTTGTSAEPDDLDFSIRRARIGFVGVYKDVYRFAYILRNDQQDKTAASANRTPETHVAYLARDFKGESATQQVRAGLDYAFFNGASLNSAGWSPVVTARATEQAAMLAPRGVGVGYKYMTPKLTVGFDIQNNVGDSTNTNGTNQGVTYNGEGMVYSGRAEFIAFDDGEKPHMKPQESFLGAPGKGVLISFEAGINRDDNQSPLDLNSDGDTTDLNEDGRYSTNTRAIGTEVFVHWDKLSAVAELRLAKAERNSSIPATVAETDRIIYLVQAAYALNAGDKIVEPAFRLTRIDLNDDNGNENTNYGTAEYGTSGYQSEIGATLYLNKNANKVAMALQHWIGEGGSAKADIVRAQWSFAF